MKTKEEIKNMLKKLESDERLSYPAANVFSNAPLALIQVELKAKVSILRWILEIQNEAN